MKRPFLSKNLLCVCTLIYCLSFISVPCSDFRLVTSTVQAGNPVRNDPKTRQAIERGMDWLISAIHRDGTVGPDRYHMPDLSCTAMTGLVLLSEGSTPRGGKYQKQSRLVLYGVLDLVESHRFKRSKENITLVQRKIGLNADLFLATLYLSQVYYDAPGEEKAIRAALDKLVNHICLREQ